MMGLVCFHAFFLYSRLGLSDFFFSKSCLLTKIALSNGHDILYMGGTYVIWNQDICYLLACAMPRTLCGDSVGGLRMSGLGGQHCLPMHLKFG